MWWKHIKFTIVLILLILLAIPAQLLTRILKEEPLFRDFDDVKEAFDMIKFAIYTLE